MYLGYVNMCGIPREHLDRIHDVLFTTKDRGSGQGLAHSQMFVTRGLGRPDQGRLGDGRGACFIIDLPLLCSRSADDSGALIQPLSTDEKAKVVA